MNLLPVLFNKRNVTVTDIASEISKLESRIPEYRAIEQRAAQEIRYQPPFKNNVTILCK
jgi:myo-inositol catabolism protein IolC